MKPIELPESSPLVILVAVGLVAAACFLVAGMPGATLWLIVLLFFASGFFGDMLTALMHFGFDYVFPYWLPFLGPIAKEFREHHEEPTLDPSDYVVNFTKGGYAAAPVALATIALVWVLPGGVWSFVIAGTFAGISIWGLFFHQIHSYAHMGSHLAPEAFNARVAEIALLDDLDEQILEFDRLFDAQPIPRWIRLLQKSRIILNPATHNLHHIRFETDFSSVNGWSDPVTNPLFRRWARYYKAREAAQTI